MLSRSQMKEVKGGLEYWEEGANKCVCTLNDTMERCDDIIRCVYGGLHYLVKQKRMYLSIKTPFKAIKIKGGRVILLPLKIIIK